MKRKSFTITLIALLALLLSVGGVAGQGPELEGEIQPEGDLSATATVGSLISYQGRLEEDGSPVTGDRDMTFRLYSDETCSPQVGSDIVRNDVTVTDGLFSVKLDVNQAYFNGQGLWLGVDVGNTGTNIVCEEILPVPYALSLRPEAVINHTTTAAVLNVFNQGNGWGLDAYSQGHDAIHGRSDAANHAGVSGNNTGGGIGVYAYTNSGVSFRAAGTGVIQSSAKSYLWISGNDLRKKNSADTTQFECDLYGGVKVRRGADPGPKDVMLPVTLPGQLYGQNVTLTGIDVYFKSQSDSDGIGGTFVHRQTGAGSGDTIIADGTKRSCPTDPACTTYHLDLTQNNVLSDAQGVVYIAFQLFFAGADTYVQIGGVRLTLKHD
jgi:hypothetical protein